MKLHIVLSHAGKTDSLVLAGYCNIEQHHFNKTSVRYFDVYMYVVLMINPIPKHLRVRVKLFRNEISIKHNQIS